MKIIYRFSFLVAISFLLQGCFKKPVACFTVSNETPMVDDFISLSSDCSEDGKWVVYEIDGQSDEGDFSGNNSYAFEKPGKHLLKLTIYTKWNGSYNSRTGCDACTGAGKSSTISKEINVVN